MGSFLNVVGLRFLRNESIVLPGSHCYACNRSIRPYDNIPILSWILLKGKCRHCGVGISLQYPAIEFLTGFLFVATIHRFGFTLQTAFLLYLIGNLIVVLITDFRERFIFVINSLGLIPFGLAFTWFIPGGAFSEGHTLALGSLALTIPPLFVSALLAVVGAYVIFFVLNVTSRLIIGQDGFGEGDTYLLMGIGSFVGVKLTILIFILSFLVQAAIGIPLTFRQWMRNRAYKAVWFTALGFACATMPYGLQFIIPNPGVILGLTLILGTLAIYLSVKALKIVKSSNIEFTFVPFGPAIVFASLLILFFEEPVLSLFRHFLPV